MQFGKHHSHGIIHLLYQSGIYGIILLQTYRQCTIYFEPHRSDPHRIRFIPEMPPLGFSGLNRRMHGIEREKSKERLLFIPAGMGFDKRRCLVCQTHG